MTRTALTLSAAMMLSACTLPNMNEQAALAVEDDAPAANGFQAVWVTPDQRPADDSSFEAYAAGELVTVDDGALVVGEDHAITLRLAAYGRDQLAPVAEARAALVEGRVEFDHGDLTEWYSVADTGVEHGFDLKAQPEGRDKHPLHFRMMLGGGEASHVGDAAHLRAGNQFRDLEVGYLEAFDSKGESLPVYLVPFDRGYDIFVDDAEAEYPIEVVPFVDVQPTMTAAY